MKSRKTARDRLRRHVRTAFLAGLAWHTAGCVSVAGGPGHGRPTRHGHAHRRGASGAEAGDLAVISRAEAAATSTGRRVLREGRNMTLRDRAILPGGCWDYADAVYKRAGFGAGDRETVFKSRKKGPYADPGVIKPGDWLSYVNHSYGGIEHSAIFVDWIDEAARTALMLSYAGERRREPARYLPYDLSNVFAVVRPRADD